MTAPIDKTIRKIVTEEAEAAARRLAREVGALAREVDGLSAYQERIKDAIRDYAERHAHHGEDGDCPRWKWKKKHCAPARGKSKRKKGGWL